jgi:hypothetical protein
MSAVLSATPQGRGPLPSALPVGKRAFRDSCQISESEACYQSQVLVRNNPTLWKLLFSLQENRRPWADIHTALMRAAVQ